MKDSLDYGVLSTLRKVHNDGAHTGILSLSTNYLIGTMMKACSYDDAIDTIVSDELVVGDGKIQEITTSLTGRKGTEFQKRFMREGSNRRKTFYIGDDYDGEDRPIAELLPRTRTLNNPSFCVWIP